MRHAERHRAERVGWLRAGVLGANDGIVSTASLIIGVAAAQATPAAVLLAGTAGLVAGAMSMAAGEYISVSSQADTERADLLRERAELDGNAAAELDELSGIYERRGLPSALAREVAVALTARDALGAHARDELGITPELRARPVQAALASAASFAAGAVLPLLVVLVAPVTQVVAWVLAAALVSLALLGVVAARIGGAPVWVGALRVVAWSALAMGLTWCVGRMFGTPVS